MRTALLLLVALFAAAVFSQTCPRCTPLCQNGDGTPKLCGDDGCGGSCGTCPAGQSCCRGGCVCQPNCAGRACGDDGCGYQSCGSCSSTQTCSNGVCVGTAVAECSGRVCGSNRAGGSCGSCPTGQRCRGGQCECFYDCEERNCGNAVQDAGANTGLCPQRSCGTCPSGFTCGDNGRCSKSDPCPVNLEVVDCTSRVRIASTATVSITWSVQVSYSASVTVSAGATSVWNTPGTGSFSFATSATGYNSNTETFDVSASTTSLQLCVRPASLQVDVRDRATDRSISVSAQVTYSGQASGSFLWNGGAAQSWTHGGFGNYNFVAVPSSGYAQGTLSTAISASTTIVVIYVDYLPVQLDVREDGTTTSINVAVSITYTGVASGSISWNGLQQWTHSGFGTYSFTAVPSSTNWGTGSLTTEVTMTTTLIIIYLPAGARCGDGICNGNEDYDFCQVDCLSLVLEMENAAGTGPVTDASINYYSANPRTPDENTGPNRNSVPVDKTRVAVPGSNVIAELTYSKGITVYFEAFRAVGDYINFFWVADTTDTRAVSEDGIYKLRVHLSTLLQSNNKNYRFVNTWKPIDAPPLPYGPTDLNLHLFHPAGALDINTKTLTQDGFEIGNAVADSKQSGGPATMDISPGAGQTVGAWNTKPPRSSAITSSQNGRSLIHSGSYVVVYGKTSNAAQGKQLGQFVLNQYLAESSAAASDTVSDLWYIGTMTVKQSGVNQPDMVAMKKLKSAVIDSTRAMIFDCEIYSYCNQYVVPYSDSGRREVDGAEE